MNTGTPPGGYTPPRERGYLVGAFAAMIFVGASWGANVPVSKVMLEHYDLIPMSALRTFVATVVLGLLLLAVEGVRALRIGLPPGRFLLLGLMMASFFATYVLGIQFSNPISAAAVQVAGPLVSRSRCGWSPARASIRASVRLCCSPCWAARFSRPAA